MTFLSLWPKTLLKLIHTRQIYFEMWSTMYRQVVLMVCRQYVLSWAGRYSPERARYCIELSCLGGGGAGGRAFSVSAHQRSLNNTNVNNGEMILGKSLILRWHFKMESSVLRKFWSALLGTDKRIAKASLRLSLVSRCTVLLVLAFAYIVTIDQGK